MNHTQLQLALSEMHSYEDFEKAKTNMDIWENLAKEILCHHQLSEASLSLFTEGTNIVFLYGDEKVIKIYPPFHAGQFERDLLVMQHLTGKLSVKTPRVEAHGEYYGWPYIIMNKLDGTLLEGLWETLDYNNKMVIIRELGALIKEVHGLPTQGLEAIDCHWEVFIDNQINQCLGQHQSKGLPDFLLTQIPDYLEDIENDLRNIKKPVLLTGEYTPMNFLVKQIGGVWHIDGLIDFGDAMLGLADYDLLGPGAFLIQGDKELLRTFLMAYGYSPDILTENLGHKLMGLMLLHQYSNLNIQIRIDNWQDEVKSLKDLEKLMWGEF